MAAEVISQQVFDDTRRVVERDVSAPVPLVGVDGSKPAAARKALRKVVKDFGVTVERLTELDRSGRVQVRVHGGTADERAAALTALTAR